MNKHQFICTVNVLVTLTHVPQFRLCLSMSVLFFTLHSMFKNRNEAKKQAEYDTNSRYNSILPVSYDPRNI